MVAKPISQIKDDEPIENFVTPPELHMLLGIFAWLFSALQRCFIDPHKIYERSNQFNVVKSRFYGGGGAYNGNSCRLLFKEHKWLDNIVTSGKGSFKINVARTFPIFEDLRPPPLPSMNENVRKCPTFKNFLELMSPLILPTSKNYPN